MDRFWILLILMSNYKIIVAYDQNQGIGKDLFIPWYFPEDLKHFKSLTLNQNVIMGYKTFQSIIEKLGKPLPKRKTIVLSKKLKNLPYDNCEVYNSIESIIEKYDSAWIAGGSEIYKLFLDKCNEMYITEVNGTYDCNVFFPEFDKLKWKKEILEVKNDFSYVRYFNIQ